MDQDACNYRTFNHIKCITHNPLQKLKAPRCCTWEFGGRVDYKTSERRLKKEQSGICKTTGCGRRQREPSPSCAARSPTSERDLRPCGRNSSRFPVPALSWPAVWRCVTLCWSCAEAEGGLYSTPRLTPRAGLPPGRPRSRRWSFHFSPGTARQTSNTHLKLSMFSVFVLWFGFVLFCSEKNECKWQGIPLGLKGYWDKIILPLHTWLHS